MCEASGFDYADPKNACIVTLEEKVAQTEVLKDVVQVCVCVEMCMCVCVCMYVYIYVCVCLRLLLAIINKRKSQSLNFHPSQSSHSFLHY